MTRTKSEYARLCGTAKSRMDLCGELRALAHRCGATLAQEAFDCDPRTIHNTFSKGPYRCNVELDGASRIDAFLGHWFTATKSDATYPRDFGATIHGDVNPYHWRKATSCHEGWPLFLQSLEAGLNALEAT